MSQVIQNLRSAYNNKVKPIMSSIYEGLAFPYTASYRFSANMVSNLIRDYRNNRLTVKSVAIFVGYICYSVFFLYRNFLTCYEIYNVGYINATINDLVNNRYLYYCFAVVYIFAACFYNGYKPLHKRYTKIKLLKSNFTTVIDLFYTINIKNNDKRTNQLYCKYILENQTSLHHVNQKFQSFTFNVYRFESNGYYFNANSFEILEYNSDKLDFNCFQLEYLFFDYDFVTKSYFSSFYNEDLTRNYPKLANKIRIHCNLMNQRIEYLKHNTPICDDVINYIIKEY